MQNNNNLKVEQYEDDVEVVRLDPSSKREVKSILFHAYKNEPTFQYLFDSDRPGYDQRIRATLRELIDLHFTTRQEAIGLATEERLIAVALIGNPDVRLNLADQLNWRMRMMLTAGLSSTRRYIDYHEQVKSCLPDNTHHELPLMGVHPDFQNQGIGKQLIVAVEKLSRENPVSSGISLDTGNSRYIRFYTSLGFKTVGEVKLGSITETVLFKPTNA